MKQVKPKDIQTKWHMLDAKNQILGRLSSKVARILMGKNKAYYVPNLDTGDHVIVVNAKEVVLSGKKETQKKYYKHSGYPGGLYSKTAAQIRASKPQELIRHSIKGMLPKTKMGRTMIKKLHIYEGAKHPHTDKTEKEITSGKE